jgi:hypothetical protein
MFHPLDLYFECLYVDKEANKNSRGHQLGRHPAAYGRCLIKEMKAAAVPEL